MKKFLFVALLGALVACNDTTTGTSAEDSARMADSIKNATPAIPDTTNMTPMTPDTSSMMPDSSSSMMSDTSSKMK